MATSLAPQRMPSSKKQINFRLSDDGKQILDQLQDLWGLTQGAIFERLLREEKHRLEEEGYIVKNKLGGRASNR